MNSGDPRQAGQRNVSATLAAKVEPRLAVAVDIAVNVLGGLHCLHHIPFVEVSFNIGRASDGTFANSNDTPSLVTVAPVTSIPALRACLTTLANRRLAVADTLWSPAHNQRRRIIGRPRIVFVIDRFFCGSSTRSGHVESSLCCGQRQSTTGESRMIFRGRLRRNDWGGCSISTPLVGRIFNPKNFRKTSFGFYKPSGDDPTNDWIISNRAWTGGTHHPMQTLWCGDHPARDKIISYAAVDWRSTSSYAKPMVPEITQCGISGDRVILVQPCLTGLSINRRCFQRRA